MFFFLGLCEAVVDFLGVAVLELFIRRHVLIDYVSDLLRVHARGVHFARDVSKQSLAVLS